MQVDDDALPPPKIPCIGRMDGQFFIYTYREVGEEDPSKKRGRDFLVRKMDFLVGFFDENMCFFTN